MAKLKVRDVVQDEKSLFNSKSISFHHQKIDTPFKLLDFSETPGIASVENWKSDALKEIDVVEISRLIKEDRFFNELNKPEANFLSSQYDSYKKTNSFQDKFFINSLTLQFNPMNMDNSNDHLTQFMNLYHGKSDFLLIPNLKVRTTVNNKQVEQVSFDEYKTYVSIAYDALDFRNSKPIFVPLSLKHGLKKFDKLLREYIDLGYRYFWMDFEGAASYSRAPYIRHFHSITDREYGIVNDVVLYATNMKREHHQGVKDDILAASDVVSSPLGIDILGTNRSPQAWTGYGPRVNKYTPDELFNNKARFLDTSNYGYVKYQMCNEIMSLFDKFNFNEAKLKNKPKFYSNLANTFKINSEFQTHKDILRNDISLLDYLSEKSFIPKNQLNTFAKEEEIKKTKDNRKKPNSRLNDFL